MATAKGATRSIYLDTTSATQAAKQLTDQVDKLDAAIVKGTKAGKDVTAQMLKLAETKNKLKEVNDVLAKGMAPSLRDLEKTTGRLRQELRGMAADSTGFKTKIAEYNKANAQLSEMRLKVQGVKQAQDSFGGKFLSFVGNVGGIVAGGVAIGALTNFLSGAVEEANAAEKSLSRLRNTLENIGRGDAFDRITQKADELANTFKFIDNDDVTEVFQQLITFGKLTENQINYLLPVIINFAAKSGISINESASVIIKALEGNGKALKEYGINVKDGENVTERLGIVMTDLKGKVEGAAEAFGETFAGQAAIASQQIANLKEEVGTELQPILGKFYEFVVLTIQGLKSIFSNTLIFFKSAATAIQVGFGFAKDLATGNAAGFFSRKAQADITAERIKDGEAIAKSTEYASKIASDAAGKTLAEQKKLLEQNKALKEASFQYYDQLVRTGKQNTTEGKKALQQMAQDAKVVIELQKVIAQGQDKSILGGGDPNAGKKTPKIKSGKAPIDQAAIDAKKAAEELARLRAEMRKIEEELGLNTLSQYERDLAKLGITYDEFLKKLQSNNAATNDDFTRLSLDRNQAIDQLNNKYLDDLQRFLDERNGKTDKANKTAFENEVDAVNKSFDAQDKAYRGNTEALKKLAEQRAKELDDLLAKLESGGFSDLSGVGTGKKTKEDDELKLKLEQKINLYLDFARQVSDILFTITAKNDAAEKASLERELKGNDAKRNSAKKLLDSKVISEQEYRRRIASLDAEAEAKRRDLEIKQFERNKKIQIAQALVNGAIGITSVLAARPGATDIITLGLFRAINIGLTIASTAAQVAAINKSKPSFARGGLLTGPSHSKGGMPVINPRTGQKEAEVEGGEVILSRNTVRNNAAAVNSLLFASMYRNGASVVAPWNNREYKSINYNNIGRRYKNGGYFADGGVFQPRDIQQPQQDNELKEVLLALLKKMDQPSIAVISQKTIDDASLQKQRILNDAALQ